MFASPYYFGHSSPFSDAAAVTECRERGIVCDIADAPGASSFDRFVKEPIMKQSKFELLFSLY